MVFPPLWSSNEPIVVVVVGPAPGPVTRCLNGPNTPAAGGGVGGRVSVASCVEALFRGGRPRFRIVYQSPFAFVRRIYHVRPVALSPQKRTIPSSRLRKNSSKKFFFSPPIYNLTRRVIGILRRLDFDPLLVGRLSSLAFFRFSIPNIIFLSVRRAVKYIV